MLDFLKKIFVPSKFILRIAKNSQFYFILISPIGETILTSEFYKNKQGALNGIDSVRRNSGSDRGFESRFATNSQRYFVLKANNNKIIGISEFYNSITDMEKYIKLVILYAKKAKLVDSIK